MSVLNYRYYGFECNYEMEGDIKIMADEFKNHIKKEYMIDYSKEIITNTILMKKPWFNRKLDACWIKYDVSAECGAFTFLQ